MKAHLICGMVILAFAGVSARGEDAESRLAFRNPNGPHTLKINAGRNLLRLKGADIADVRAISSRPDAPPAARTDGMRVLTSAVGFSLTLENPGVMMLDAGIKAAADPSVAAGVITVMVPRNTTLIVRSLLNSEVMISDIDGDVEVMTTNGKITLERLRGGALVESNRGDIDASFSEFSGGKPLSFSSVAGAVTVRVPEKAMASVRLRTQNGNVMTNFEETTLVVRTEALPVVPADTGVGREGPAAALQRGGGQAPADLKAQREAAARAGAGGRANKMPGANPGANSFSFTGGHSVSGALNGGGPEISITTLSGDVTFRKL